MIRHRDGGSGRNGGSGLPASPYELGRTLRRVRTRQGLQTEDVSARTGLPLDQLALLESGSVTTAHDRVAVLRTLRRYADFLGLPGDRYVLVLIDHWPEPAAPATGPGPQIVAVHPTTATATATALRPGPYDTGTMPVTSLSRPPAAGTGGGSPAVPVETATGVVQIGAAGSWAAGVPGGPASHDANTGMIAAVPAARPQPEERRAARTPLALRLAVWLVVLALVAGVAGLVIHRYEPHWLNTLGITHSTTPPAPSGGGGGSHPKPPATAPVFSVKSTSLSTATFEIRAPAYLVGVVAAGSPSWMQATQPPASGSGPPTVLFAGILPSGQTKDFLVARTMTLEVGSAAAHVYITVGKKLVGFYYPHSAPFTMTFDTSG